MKCEDEKEGGCKWIDYAMKAGKESKKSAECARESAEKTKFYAERVEKAAENAGFADFDIENGRLILTKSEKLENVDFEMDEGRLKVRYGKNA